MRGHDSAQPENQKKNQYRSQHRRSRSAIGEWPQFSFSGDGQKMTAPENVMLAA
jgi:hypothetical protein